MSFARAGLWPSLGGVKNWLMSQSALLTNTAAVSTGTLTASVLGFLYWFVAAQSFPAKSVGFAAAAISLLALIGLLGEIGLGALIIAEVQRHRERAAELCWAAMWLALLGGTVCGILALLAIWGAALDLGAVIGEPEKAILFVASCGLTSFVLVLDQAFVALLNGTHQMYRNILFSVLKLALLGGLVFVDLEKGYELPMFATWVLASLVASIIAIAGHPALRAHAFRLPDFSLLGDMKISMASHQALNIAVQAPGLIMPALVTHLLGPQVNAAFYAAWMMLAVAKLVPGTITTVLVSHATRDPTARHASVRLSLRICALIGVAAALGFLVLGPFALRLFHPEYTEIMGQGIQVLGFAVLGTSVKYLYTAVARLDKRMAAASGVMLAGGILELGMAAFGGMHYGIVGLTIGWLIAVTIEAAFMYPMVDRSQRIMRGAVSESGA